jgi:hypothetical protein
MTRTQYGTVEKLKYFKGRAADPNLPQAKRDYAKAWLKGVDSYGLSYNAQQREARKFKTAHEASAFSNGLFHVDVGMGNASDFNYDYAKNKRIYNKSNKKR